jgi:Transglycosylase SLT domain
MTIKGVLNRKKKNKKPLNNEGIRIVAHIATNTIKNIESGKTLLRLFPSLSIKFLFLYSILFALRIRKGVNMPIRIPNAPKTAIFSLAINNNIQQDIIDMLKAIPATFRLYNLCLVQKLFVFIGLFKQVYKYIISQFCSFSKPLVVFVAFILAANSCFADDYSKKIREAEIKHKIPKDLLLTIAKVESRMHPWTINSPKGAYYAQSKEEAQQYLNDLIEQGITNIDIGLAQLNFKWHKEKFVSPSEMLDPDKNIEYAAKLLASLQESHGEWHIATAYYHSYNPIHYKKYFKKVLVTWLQS